MGAMLALSAIFAVVISTISMPGDGATAQATTDPAEAWWGQLSDVERLNVLAGKGSDVDTATDGRQYARAAYNLATYSTGTNLTVTATSTHLAYANLNSGTATTVDEYADGNTDNGNGNELYAVGEQLVSNSKGIRGFQSVELWWDHLTCAEARIAVGEDSGALATGDFDTTESGFQTEPTDVCDATLNTDGDAVTSTSVKAYSGSGGLSADAKTQVDEVGQAILGLSSAGSASSADNARAKAWWDSLSSGEERVKALYGNNSSLVVPGDPSDDPGAGNLITVTRVYLASLKYSDIKSDLMFTFTRSGAEVSVGLDAASKALVPQVKELINDRWQWIYDMGGMNDDNKAELVYWWDSIDTAQKRIAVGFDNQPTTSTAPAEYGLKWDALNPDTDAAGKARNAKVFEVGQAILGQTVLPQVGAWWGTLSADQMVNVVYGSPLAMEDDPSDNVTNAMRTVAWEIERKAFQKMYADLTGAVLHNNLPAVTQALLTRNSATAGFDLNDNDSATDNSVDNLSEVTVGFDLNDDGDATDTDVDGVNETNFRGVKAIVDAIANELFDAPIQLPGTTRVTVDSNGERTLTPTGTEGDDNDFDWPYNSANKPANVADWWETTDCRVMRLAVGQDNDYLHTAVDAVAGIDANNDRDFTDAADTRPADAVPEETSIYCGHFPGHDDNADNDLSEDAQKRVVVVGKALLGLTADSNGLHAGRPSFNVAVTGIPTITGTAQVGSTLTAHTDAIGDGDGVGDWNYQWLRSGTDIAGATGSTYTLTAADANAMISVRVSFTDGERYPEATTSVGTSVVAGSPGMILRVEPNIRGIAISGGDTVVLSVNVYGLQDKMDNKLGGTYTWSVNGTGIDGSGRELSYTAPTSPGTYNVKATLADGDCAPKDETMRASACSAEFEVKVLRPSAPQPAPEAPVNPPGEIPSILADSEGEQYEVFTPVEGGKFEGNGYSVTAAAGAVSNGEFIGVRMSDDGAASNAGMTHQRYTLGGNMYGVHAVDSTGAAISSYVLEDAATVCVPLPDELRSNISDLAVVAINGDGSLTILSAQVRITTAGTMVCGGLSNLPASVAVGSAGAPAAIPTPTPEPTPEPPVTGGTAPASSATVLWALLLGVAVLTLGAALVIARRREGTRKS